MKGMLLSFIQPLSLAFSLCLLFMKTKQSKMQIQALEIKQMPFSHQVVWSYHTKVLCFYLLSNVEVNNVKDCTNTNSDPSSSF